MAALDCVLFVAPLQLCVRAVAPEREEKIETDEAVSVWISVQRECGEELETVARATVSAKGTFCPWVCPQ